MAQSTLENGRFRLELNYRDFRGDEGLSIRVVGPVKNEDRELIRFDCFLKTPHYHIGVYDQNKITSIKADDPVAFALEQLDTEFSNMVDASGGDSLSQDEQATHQAMIAGLREEAKQVIATAKS